MGKKASGGSGGDRAVGGGRPGAIYTAALALLICLAASLCVGRYPLGVRTILDWLAALVSGGGGDRVVSRIILDIRLPRILIAVFAGAALSVAGAAYQGIFRNPMASPDVLGVSAGAGFGAALGILLSLPAPLVQLVSFAFGILAVTASVLIAWVAGRRQNITLVLVLSGMMVSSLFSAFISLVKYLADPNSQLPEITYWLMGSFSAVNKDSLLPAFVSGLIAFLPLMLLRWRINLLTFGEEEARAMGINTAAIRAVAIGCATLLTASVVSIGGQIGWIGLVIPHLSRMVAGPNYLTLLPLSFLAGGIGLLVVDTVARSLIQIELPLSVLTALIGAPFFVFLLIRKRKGWT
ncbi:MAG: iron ABC transporter permease [Treponema sp.]|jgi:iron complex transport system permease protein|nr:iron ABC transporter permease [Treponema sp.]